MNYKANIMIVENEGIVIKDIESILQQFGYTVSAVVFSGEEAIKVAEEKRPDLVLSEISLEGSMDGIEVAHQIYSRFNIPVVFLTATTDLNTIERAKLVEPYGFVIKPFEENSLHANIEMALYRHGVEMSKHKQKGNKPEKTKEHNRVNTSESGLQKDWTRATFIIKKEHMEKIKALAYWERKKVKEIVDDALESYLKDKKIEIVRKI